MPRSQVSFPCPTEGRMRSHEEPLVDPLPVFPFLAFEYCLADLLQCSLWKACQCPDLGQGPVIQNQ